MMFYANKRKTTEKTTVEKLSARIMYALTALTVIIFGCFYTIGYDIPFDEDPQFKSPLFTDAVLAFVFFLIITALSAIIYAIIKEARRSKKATLNADNILSRRIAVITAAVTGVCMAVTFIAGSSHPMFINGTQYTTAFWLKASDMFITTIAALIFAAIIIVMTGRIRYSNGNKKGNRQ